MALIYIDGFDTYPTADIGKRWIDSSNVGAFTIVSSGGRNGGGCLRAAASNLHLMTRSLGAAKASIAVGVAMKYSGGTPNAAGAAFLFLQDAANNQVVLKVDSAGNLKLYSDTTLIASYSAGIVAGVFHYYEIKVTISNSISAGSCVVYLDGLAVITPAAATNLRQGSTTASVDRVSLGTDNQWSTANVDFDDFYMLDTTGTYNVAPLGDVRVEGIRPTGAGNSTQFTPNTGANYAAVLDTAQDGDTTYVSSGTVGNIDTYAMGDLASTPATVFGVQLCLIARKDDAGSRSIAGVIRSGGTTYDHGSTTPLSVSDGYGALVDLWEKDPNGTIAWTGSSVNAMEAGVKLVA